MSGGRFLTIPLVYVHFHVGNLFSPDGESFWGSSFEYRKRMEEVHVCALEP